MVLDFSWLPPEINSARIFAGAGSGPLHVAASAWDGVAQDLWASAARVDSGVGGVTAGAGAGAAAAGQAWWPAAQARGAGGACETALGAAVHPAVVTANRTTLSTLIATNFF